MGTIERKIIFHFLFFFYLLPLFGQQGSLSFQHLISEDDLSDLYNEYIFQDSRGLVWISSSDGLNIFDGKKVTNFKPNSPNSKNIRGTHISSDFFEDSSSNIWFTSDDGINCYDRAQDEFFFYQLETGKSQLGISDYYGFYLDQYDRFWLRIGMDNEGQLHIFDTKNKTLHDTHIGSIDGLRIKVVTNAKKNVSQLISSYCFSEKGLDIIEIDSNSDRVFQKEIHHHSLGDIKPKDGYVDHTSNIVWLGSSKGLIEFNLSSHQFKLHKNYNGNFIGKIWDIEAYKDNQLFISSSTGILIFNKKDKNFIEHHQAKNLSTNGLLESNSEGLYIDHDDNLWISQWGKGINFTNLKKNKFTLPSATKGLEILHLVENHDQNIWVSTNQSEVLVYSPNYQLIDRFEIINQSEKRVNLKQLFLSPNNEVWGIEDQGIAYYKFDNNKKTFKEKGQFPEDFTFRKIIKTKEGKIYGFILGKKSIFEIKANKDLLTFDSIPHFDFSETQHIRKYFEDQNNITYLYDSKGSLSIFTKKNNDFNLTKTIPISELCFDFYDIPNQPFLLIATNQGLKKFSQETFEFVSFEEGKYNLPSQIYFSIIPDKNGELWLPSNNGLVKYNHTTGMHRIFSIADGLQGKTFNENCALKASDGKIWIGGINGLNIIDPSDIKYLTTPPQIYFSKFLVDNDTISLRQPIHDLKEIHLSNSQNTFSLEYVAIDYSDCESVKAKYRILGPNDEDETWIETDRSHVIERYDMKGGDYVIEVLGANSDGIWMDEKEAKRIAVKIDLHYSETLLFRLGVPIGFSLFSIFFFIWRYKKKAAEKFAEEQRKIQAELAEGKRKNKERLQEEKIKNLEELNLFKSTVYSNITHEFKTPVTIIKGYAEMIDGNEKEKTIINRSSNDLLRLINQVIDVSKLESSQLKATYIQADVIGYLKHFVEPFQSLANKKQLTFSIDFEEDSWLLDYDEQKLEHIVSNLLSNAIKFTPRDGQIDLKVGKFLQEGKEFLKIEVKDTGVGISKEFQKQIFDRHFQIEKDRKLNKGGTGIGLAFCKDLVELMGGNISITSDIGSGSHFKVLLPAHYDAVKEEKFYHLEEKSAMDAIPLQPVGIDEEDDRPVLLIIEDNIDVSNFIRAIIGTRYQTLVAYDGEEGLQLAKAHLPDLIVSDVMMPNKNGFEVCEHLKNDIETSHIPLILLTAKDGFRTEIEALTRGADVYMKKPFRSELLLIHLASQYKRLNSIQQRYENLKPEDEPKDDALEIEDKFVKDLREFVEENITTAKPRDLDEVFNMTTSTLIRKLKTLTKKTPSQFIRTIRLQVAEQLLITTDERVSQIAYQVGFNTPEHFSKEFKLLFGKSPKEYRDKSN